MRKPFELVALTEEGENETDVSVVLFWGYNETDIERVKSVAEGFADLVVVGETGTLVASMILANSEVTDAR